MYGTGVSPGISIGTASLVRKKTGKVSGIITAGDEERISEVKKFTNAVSNAVAEIEAMMNNRSGELQKTEIDLLDTHIEFLNDPQIRTDILEKINVEHKTAADSVIEVINAAASMFDSMEDDYLRERSADIRDIGSRILSHIDDVDGNTINTLPENTILIADDITPSDIISIDITRIAGFATRKGGKTSHAAIIARSRGIPAVVGCGDGLTGIANNDLILLDGTAGEVIINPDNVTEEAFRIRQKEFRLGIASLSDLRDKPAVTGDGHRLKLYANIGGPSDMDKVIESGGEGVGLLRTEILFMDRDSMPGEEEQFLFYREIAEKAGKMPVTVRTMDIGGDKKLSYLQIPEEENPFMGYRAIRLCLDREELFITQLKAILRAGYYGNLRIMFPMISSAGEIRKAKKCVAMAKEELSSKGLPFPGKIDIGIMIEIPSAAIMAGELAREVDFFSIGTNDLCQYTLAVDRMNEKVSPLYNHFNPAVLRLIAYTIEQGSKNNIHVGLCGEMAGDPLATRVLMGMGLEEFSMASSSIPVIKKIIRDTDMTAAVKIWNTARSMTDPDEITGYLKER